MSRTHSFLAFVSYCIRQAARPITCFSLPSFPAFRRKSQVMLFTNLNDHALMYMLREKAWCATTATRPSFMHVPFRSWFGSREAPAPLHRDGPAPAIPYVTDTTPPRPRTVPPHIRGETPLAKGLSLRATMWDVVERTSEGDGQRPTPGRRQPRRQPWPPRRPRSHVPCRTTRGPRRAWSRPSL